MHDWSDLKIPINGNLSYGATIRCMSKLVIHLVHACLLLKYEYLSAQNWSFHTEKQPNTTVYPWIPLEFNNCVGFNIGHPPSWPLVTLKLLLFCFEISKEFFSLIKCLSHADKSAYLVLSVHCYSTDAVFFFIAAASRIIMYGSIDSYVLLCIYFPQLYFLLLSPADREGPVVRIGCVLCSILSLSIRFVFLFFFLLFDYLSTIIYLITTRTFLGWIINCEDR